MSSIKEKTGVDVFKDDEENEKAVAENGVKLRGDKQNETD